MMFRRRMPAQQRTPEQLARLYATQGRCPKCNVILTWDSRDVPGHITKGELACPDCGSVLLRTNSHSPLARVAKNPKPVTAPSRTQEMIRGERAIEAAKNGAPLFVWNDQKGWIPAGPGAVERAGRMLPHALWIYGVVHVPYYKSEQGPGGVEACKAGTCMCDTRCPGSDGYAR